MNIIEQESKTKNLFERWRKERPEYENKEQSKRFVKDGIQNFEQWNNAIPKILFLMKEAHSEFEPNDSLPIGNKFSLNIARWREAIMRLFENINENILFRGNEEFIGTEISDIAIVEVKKLDEGKTTSIDEDINKYAQQDRDLLKEQINLINPHIVLCGYTNTPYGIIYGGEVFEKLTDVINTCDCFKHNNRLVINFYHPSNYSFPEGDEGLFDLLCKLLKNGKVFEKFDWVKN